MSTKKKKVLSLFLALVMVFSLLPGAAFATQDDTSEQAASDPFMKIVFLDCGRKYFSVDSIKKIIDNAAAAGFNYIQLAVGNDGLRFLLDDMSLTVNGTTYTSEQVSAAIHSGNETYYDFTTDELTQDEMDTIIAYANKQGLAVIPCVNTPGHMDAILSAANSLTGTTCSYNGSARTIDVTNTTAVAFTQALLQKYITYFAGKGCEFFNMGADEYANDKYASGSMGFGNLQSTGKYSYYVHYVNQVAGLIKDAHMTPMAFNDGIYFAYNTSSGTFDTDIVICYWSSGWSGYNPMSASNLAGKGFKLVNTNGDYYWVLGKPDAQCSHSKASGFTTTAFPGGTVSNPAGAMFCIWCDYPGAEPEASVVSKTTATIEAFGKTLPKTDPLFPVEPTISSSIDLGSVVTGAEFTLSLSEGTTAEWKSSDPDVISIYATRGTVSANSVTVKALKAGSATITATLANGTAVTKDITVTNLPTKEFTIAVGETKTDTQAGNYPGPYSGYDSSIATVAGEAKEIAGSTGAPIKQTTLTSGSKYIIGDGNGNYLKRSETTLMNVTSPDDATEWTVTWKSATTGSNYSGWKISDGSYYLRYYTSYTSDWNLNVSTTDTMNTWGYDSTGGGFRYHTLSSFGRYLYCSNSSWQISSSSNNGAAYVKGTPTPGGYETTISFGGVAVGTTTVDIGGVHYIINVVPEDLSNVTPLTIEYWITNRPVTADNAISKTISATDDSVYSQNGAQITDLVPLTGIQDNNPVVYYKTTRLTAGNKQTDVAGVDQTLQGDDFTYIRYWDGKWSFSTDRTNWTNINDSDQIVTYYLQKTTVTAEVTTNIVDWGQPYSEWKEGTENSWFWTGYVENGSKYVFLDFAVVYEDGTQNPSSFPVDNTLFYHFDGCSATKPRVLGAISFTEDDYEIWKVTVTDGTSTGYSNVNTFKPTYYDSTETIVWDESYGGKPHIDQLSYTANQSGKLVRVYVRAKVTEDSLTVRYIDKATGTEFYSYNITVNSGTAFKETIRLNDPWKGPLYDGDVTNSLNVQQKVNADLSTMPRISPQYRYAVKYTCDEVKRSDNGKEVTLYYTFTSNKSFVIDYGLPLTIKPTDISSTLKNATINSVKVIGNTNATITYIGTDTFTYTLDKMMNVADQLSVTYQGSITTDEGTQANSVTYTIYICPASTMYYEDNFASFAPGTGVANGATWSFDGASANNTPSQTVQELNAGEAIYGYDVAYENDSTFSMGSAHKVTVTADMLNNWKNDNASSWPTATFTFKGTGFDIISLTNSDSGNIFVTVKDTAGKSVKKTMVNNYYGYIFTGGEWTATPDPNKALYQVPVIKITDLTYGEYTVEIKVAYHSFFDKTGDDAFTFWLDAIRVYDPANKNNSDTYLGDKENRPTFQEIRDLLIKAGTLSQDNATSGAVFIDGKETVTDTDISDYVDRGPNNEVYLTNDQAIAFKLMATGENKPGAVQLGIRLANGTANGKINVFAKDKTTVSAAAWIFNTATDMYYKLDDVVWNESGSGKWVSDPIVIKNISENTVISLTTLKITGSYEFDTLANVQASTAPMKIAFFVDPSLVDFAHKALAAAPVQPSTGGGGGGGGGSTGGVISSDPTNVPGSDWKNPYDDVKDGSWYYDYVKTVTEAGLMNGQGSGFGPDGKLTRAMMVTILYRMSGSPAVTGENPFTDVPAGTWYSDAVLWAYDKGIVKGTSETTFAPTADITRQDMATIIARYAAAFQIELKAADGTTFSDDSAIAGYAKDAVYSMKASGILSGKGNDRFDPKGTTTRAETAKVIALLHAI